MAVLREAERAPVLIQEVLLLETNPEVRIVLDGGAIVGGVRGAVRVHDFAENDKRVLAAGIGIEGHRMQNAVRALALGLHRGTAVKPPQRHVSEGRWLVK